MPVEDDRAMMERSAGKGCVRAVPASPRSSWPHQRAARVGRDRIRAAVDARAGWAAPMTVSEPMILPMTLLVTFASTRGAIAPAIAAPSIVALTVAVICGATICAHAPRARRPFRSWTHRAALLSRRRRFDPEAAVHIRTDERQERANTGHSPTA
jgi:hypothetical protein